MQFVDAFTWTLMKHLWTIRELADIGVDEPVVVDECGRTYTPKEFLEIVDACPIQFQLPVEFC